MMLIGKLIHSFKKVFTKKLDEISSNDIRKIGVIIHSLSENYAQFINSLIELKEDYIIFNIDTNHENALKADYDMIIFSSKDFNIIGNLIDKNKYYGVFLDGSNEQFPHSQFKNKTIYWYNCINNYPIYEFKIPINFTLDNKIDSIQLIKNVSYRIRDGLDILERKHNKYSNLLLPSQNLHTGRMSFANRNFKIKGKISVNIGSYCSFGEDVLIITENHDTQYLATQGYLYNYYFNTKHAGELQMNNSKERSKGSVIIKNDVWIGDRVIILSGVTIGNGACIAAGSVVTKDVEDYAVVAGVPAKKIKQRFESSKISQIIELSWWNWSNKKIRENKTLFFEYINNIEDGKN